MDIVRKALNSLQFSSGKSIFILAALLLCFFSILTTQSAQSANEPLAPTPKPPPVLNLHAYIPNLFIGSPTDAGLFGYVTQSNQPAQGVTLQLSKLDGTTETTIGTTITDSRGYYSFTSIPAIVPSSGVTYFTRYAFFYADAKNDLPGRLSYWKTRAISSYSTDQIINIGNFDIGDIVLDSPVSSFVDEVGLPVTFKWIKRSYSPSDSYYLGIVDQSLINYAFISNKLGYINSFLFNQTLWSQSMKFGDHYFWNVKVESPNGGVGVSRYMHEIIFKAAPP
jgi:hypothetical protein